MKIHRDHVMSLGVPETISVPGRSLWRCVAVWFGIWGMVISLGMPAQSLSVLNTGLLNVADTICHGQTGDGETSPLPGQLRWDCCLQCQAASVIPCDADIAPPQAVYFALYPGSAKSDDHHPFSTFGDGTNQPRAPPALA